MPREASLRDRTIADFGDQWTAYSANEGYYASEALFADLVEPLVELRALRDARVADVGSGTGRIVRMLAGVGAAYIVAVEPSAAFDKLVENTADLGTRVRPMRCGGEELPIGLELDWVVSFGVLHHIPDPDPVMRRAYGALRPGGKMLAWLYGLEGNRLYLAMATPLRAVTRRLPHGVLANLSAAIDFPLRGYMRMCERMPLPMRDYMRNHLGKLSADARRLTIYDQLNPAYAKYYSRDEARALFERAGFVDVRMHHRHQYSWLVVGTRADDVASNHPY